ncbi:putative two-component system sensor kinase [Patulibacter medicamentivorans]|uniref:histidine kinase n=1 Tax=Patulibacter medicamentivorans TaxID=1097667 RepID=H0E445_9ACTN|nr:sensor domain-containing protein [Patulibacter medicamentivorans]EHN11550.1 putative two-component system sensor kinase [Patulibacter medicamentivorans]
MSSTPDPTPDQPVGEEPVRDDVRTGDAPTREAAAVPASRDRRRRLAAHGDRAWHDFAYLMLGGVIGTAFFSIAVTMVSLSLGLLVLIVGIPIAMLSSQIIRWCAEIERRRTLIVDPDEVRGAYRPLGEGLLGAAQAMVSDPRRWKDVGYSIVQFPVTLAGFCAASLWALPLGYLTVPLWYWAIPEGVDMFGFSQLRVDSLGEALACIPFGLLLIPVAYWLGRGATIVSVGLTRSLLGDERAELVQRVSHLEETRAGAVDAAAAELKRIERDLHDGAQARMVAVAMDLGMAEERVDRDPEAARELIQGARAEARRALAEMRDLVRGIAPSVLADRGLDAALSSLVARSPIPVMLDVELERRPPSSAETAAYFVVSESLVNIAKHAGAASCTVTVRGTSRLLRVEISDDGSGGAQILPGGGLAGLRDRVAALDGMLEMESPIGGPTVVRATIPCVS